MALTVFQGAGMAALVIFGLQFAPANHAAALGPGVPHPLHILRRAEPKVGRPHLHAELAAQAVHGLGLQVHAGARRDVVEHDRERRRLGDAGAIERQQQLDCFAFLTGEGGRPVRYPLNDYYRTPNMERLAARGLTAADVTNALRDRPLPLYGDGRNERDWLHVADHCRAISLLVDEGRLSLLGRTFIA